MRLLTTKRRLVSLVTHLLSKVVPKDAATMMALQKSVTGNVLFTHLEKDELTDVLDAMFLVTKEPEDIIIQQGDEGDNFYIIDSGIVEVSHISM
jgi:cAMP-dependent protein kinase regulator